MSSFVFRTVLMGSLLTLGPAFAEIIRNGRGEVVSLWPIPAARVRIKNDGVKLSYVVRMNDNREVSLQPSEVLHIMGLTLDGFTALSPIAYARESIGLGIAATEYGSRFFSNDATPGFVLVHPNKLSKEASTRLAETWNAAHQGSSAARKTAVLEEGLKPERIGIPPEDSQFLETRKFQVEEIARIFRIPPHMIAALDRATFSNIEHQGLEFVVHTLRPWLVAWEQEINRKFFPKGDYFAEFLVDGLLRGDVASRFSAYATAVTNGWFSPNDVRRLENMNPIDGGDQYFRPLNMTPITESSRELPVV